MDCHNSYEVSDNMNSYKDNPFEKGCKNCIKNIWETINIQAEKLNKKCYPNTYIWIEKFKDDNY